MRHAIHFYLTKHAKGFVGKLLDIGCGRMPYRKWIKSNAKIDSYLGLDIENPIYQDKETKPDIFWDGVEIPLNNNEYESAILLEVLEHCEFPEKVIREAYRTLKPGGRLIFSVPFLWFYHDTPYDFNRFTAYKLKSLFEGEGFVIKDLKAYGDWNNALAHFWSLWLKRSKLPKFLRFGLYLLFFPVYFLMTRKVRWHNAFETHDIAIGHVGVVEKP